MSDKVLTPAEVAAIFRVDPKTVTRWAKKGKLPFIQTLGGHRRYKESVIKEILDQQAKEKAEAEEAEVD